MKSSGNNNVCLLQESDIPIIRFNITTVKNFPFKSFHSPIKTIRVKPEFLTEKDETKINPVQLKLCQGIKKIFRIFIMLPTMIPDNHRNPVIFFSLPSINAGKIKGRIKNCTLFPQDIDYPYQIHIRRLFYIFATSL